MTANKNPILLIATACMIFQRYVFLSIVGVLAIASTLTYHCGAVLCIKTASDLMTVMPLVLSLVGLAIATAISPLLIKRRKYICTILLSSISIVAFVGALIVVWFALPHYSFSTS